MTASAVPGGLEGLRFWLRRCLADEEMLLKKFNHLKDAPGREVWEVTARSGGQPRDFVLSIFHEASLDVINTNLPPELAARKCYLCCNEMPALGVPTPRAVGWAVRDGTAVLLTEKVIALPRAPSVTRVAAACLARLHRIRDSDLSDELRSLVEQSDPREERTTGGRAPEGGEPVLVHGDFWSANILAARNGLRIVDWETFGRGDAMWDLGTLIGADRNLPDSEVEIAIEEYGKLAPVDRERLQWHRERWRRFFALRAAD